MEDCISPVLALAAIGYGLIKSWYLALEAKLIYLRVIRKGCRKTLTMAFRAKTTIVVPIVVQLATCVPTKNNSRDKCLILLVGGVGLEPTTR